jgi:hypothetical protein
MAKVNAGLGRGFHELGFRAAAARSQTRERKMTQKWVWTCLAAASMATAITLAPIEAQAQARGGAGVSAGARNFSAAPRAGRAAPLTITRHRAYVTHGVYRYGGYRYGGYYGGPYYDGGWFPGLLAAPFLLTGALLGAGLGYGYGYDYYPYGGGYYYTPAGYGGAVGDFCATPARVCQLITPAVVGGGCSCRAPGGGRFRGSVVP